jgi:hypothetical protein
MRFTFSHYKAIDQARLGALSFVFLLEPLGVVMPDSRLSIGLTLPAHGLVVDAGGSLSIVGATTVLGFSPSVALAAAAWTEISVVGSHLELVPLYCQHRGDYFELRVETSTQGTCLIAVGTAGVAEVTFVSHLGQRVPGGGLLTVVEGGLGDLWPRLDTVVKTTGLGMHLEGAGFRAEESFCLLTYEGLDIEVPAKVVSPTVLVCPLSP